MQLAAAVPSPPRRVLPPLPAAVRNVHRHMFPSVKELIVILVIALSMRTMVIANRAWDMIRFSCCTLTKQS